MADNTKDIFETVEEEYEFLDTVELDGETYFMLIPASDSEDMAYDYFHSTTTQAARTAKAANVKHLVLTHISSRYMREDVEALLQEAISIFPNTVIAEDLSKLNIVSS